MLTSNIGSCWTSKTDPLFALFGPPRAILRIPTWGQHNIILDLPKKVVGGPRGLPSWGAIGRCSYIFAIGNKTCPIHFSPKIVKK